MIQVSNLDKSYGGQVLFDKVGFLINPGERLGLVGRNGHGKTTLFRLILGQEHQDSGVISIPTDDKHRASLAAYQFFGRYGAERGMPQSSAPRRPQG